MVADARSLRKPSILDVVRAVKHVAALEPHVRAWWYAPPVRMRLAGERRAAEPARALEVVIEASADLAECARIARALSHELGAVPLSVRVHSGAEEPRHLFRLMSDAAHADTEPR